MSKNLAIEHISADSKERELKRAQSDLYFLACKLGYEWSPKSQQGLTSHLHAPIAARMDILRDHQRVGTWMPRKTCKSTMLTICLAVQEILRDPDITIMVNHQVENEAIKIVNEIGNLFWENEWLRSLDPMGVYPEGHKKAGMRYRVCPDRRERKFLTASGFTIKNRPKMNPTTRRQQTCVGKGSGSEITGTHVDLILLDDIIGLTTLEDSTGMAKIRDWLRSTATNVLNAGGRIRVVGTRWDEYDVYYDMLKSNQWDCVVRHAIETEDGEMGQLDPGTGRVTVGEVIHYGPTPKGGDGIKEARARERMEYMEMGPRVYAAQRMNDPSPADEKPWDPSECENFVDIDDIGGFGVIYVLSDPAPAATGSYDETGYKSRGDGTKDDWALAVVKLQVVNNLQRAVLLEVKRSKTWTITEGFNEAFKLMTKYRTNKLFNESYGGLAVDYSDTVRQMARSQNVSVYFDPKTRKLPRFENSYVKGAKNQRFAKLADWARTGKFVMSRDTISQEGLKMFLDQARGWRPLPGGRNSNRYDDVADVVSRCTDNALQHFAPKPDYHSQDNAKVFSPYRQRDTGRQVSFGRYINF